MFKKEFLAMSEEERSKEADMTEIDPEEVKKAIQGAAEFKQRLIISLTWLIEDAKHRFDDCKNNLEAGSEGGYSDELKEAMAALKILEGKT